MLIFGLYGSGDPERAYPSEHRRLPEIDKERAAAHYANQAELAAEWAAMTPDEREVIENYERVFHSGMGDTVIHLSDLYDG